MKVAEIVSEIHENTGEEHMLEFTHIEINGLTNQVATVVMNGQPLDSSLWEQMRGTNRLEINGINIPIDTVIDIRLNVY